MAGSTESGILDLYYLSIVLGRRFEIINSLGFDKI